MRRVTKAAPFSLAVLLSLACGSRTPIDSQAGSSGGFAGTNDEGRSPGGAGLGATGGAGPGATGGAAAGATGGAGRAGASGAAGMGGDPTLPDGCVRTTCTPQGGRYCGIIGDGCGDRIDCGECPTGDVCGLRTPGVCGTPCPLCGDIPSCDGASTTISGIAVTGSRVDPDPLYKALVYIPNIAPGARLPPLADGPICNRCIPLTPDTAVSSAITGPDGRFTLTNVPAGKGIPLVVQLDRWRYQTTIDVVPCTDNALPDGTARLPRNHLEGDIPLTAVSTGQVDAVECVLRKMGVDDWEFTNPALGGRIQIYRSNGAVIDSFTPAETQLTANGTSVWDRYTQIILACEGRPTSQSTPNLASFVDYVNHGGRVFATHYRYTWLYMNSPFNGVAQWHVDTMPVPTSPLTGTVDTSIPKGADFAAWLQIVGALSQPSPPQVAIFDPRNDLTALNPSTGVQRWIYSNSPATVQHFTIDTPLSVTPDKVCGRVVFSDFHVLNAMNTGLTFPGECITSRLSAQERVLEFMLLDLASCTGSTTPPPVPPPPPISLP